MLWTFIGSGTLIPSTTPLSKKVIRPRQRDVRAIIHKTIEYVVRFGAKFERELMHRSTADSKVQIRGSRVERASGVIATGA